MGEGDKRNPRRSAKYDVRELARLSKKHVATEAEWDEKLAEGALKVQGTQPVARTTTLDDPLTTSLLAEVARRSKTIEVEPEQIDEALDVAPNGEPGSEPGSEIDSGPASEPGSGADHTPISAPDEPDPSSDPR